MNTKLTTRTAIAALGLGLVLTGCTAEPVEPAVPVATEQPATPAPAPEPVEPEVPAVTADSPVGTEVPADQVQALRAEGVHVYVPRTGEAAVIVAPGEVPDQVIEHVRAEAGSGSPQDVRASVSGIMSEFEDAGTAALILVKLEAGYTVFTPNVPGAKEFWTARNGGAKGWDTKEQAIAEVQPLTDANPEATLIDATI
ncbi:hypothetical protein GXB85_13610 [Cellulomonas sp. APG4]|uniref:hypothetical protein n=1 Tax=Cellulomonas sp. APG4 TaxID=1538656 RepID=UPI00137B1422|nr:hypothetical protein [Cellulomonas sp. APG4]NCT91979.1 hypothetical protein [Cellulomonas sp. APG4]